MAALYQYSRFPPFHAFTGNSSANYRQQLSQVVDNVVHRKCTDHVLAGRIIPTYMESGIDPPLHITGKRIADQQAVVPRDARDMLQYIIKIELIRFFIAHALRHKRFFDIRSDQGTLHAVGMYALHRIRQNKSGAPAPAPGTLLPHKASENSRGQGTP